MSFSQKKKRSILPVTGGLIEEEYILDSQKSRTNKSLLDFKSPKLNRLKNFIKSPVQKSYNKYKQFQDNDDDNLLTGSTSLESSPIKRQSIDSKNIDVSSESTVNYESKDISQTSLLTTVSTVPPEFYPTQKSCFADEMMSRNVNLASKNLKSELTIDSVSMTGGLTDKYYRPAGGSFKEFISRDRMMVKSASSGALCDPKISDSNIVDQDESVSLDKPDGGPSGAVVASSGDNKSSSRWNPTVVDIETTEIMIQSLDDHIKNTKDKIFKEKSVKDQMVDKLITNFSSHSQDSKTSKKMCKEYELKNKNAEKLLEKSHLELEQLEFKRMIVIQLGIPWGVNPADYVKSINKKDKIKRKIVPETKQSPGPLSKFIKGYSKKSASAENISRLGNDTKNPENHFNKSSIHKEDINKSKESSYKKKNFDDTSKSLLSADSSNASKVIHQNFNPKKTGSAGANSAMSLDQQYGDKTSIPKKSKSNSMSSGTGKDQTHESLDIHESPKNHNYIVHDEIERFDEKLYSRNTFIQNEISSLRNDLGAIRSDFQSFQCETHNLRLDMETNSELNSQKMQNSIERVDRLERMLDLLRQQCQIEFCTWKDDFRNLEEKLDYRLTTTRRDLQDNIDSCNNSINLIEKRTEQIPFLSNRAGKSDVKIITDQLCNLVVSLIAFIMLLLSSGFHLLIRFLNIGATICRHRNTILPPVILSIALFIAAVKWSLWSKLCTLLSESGYLPNI